MNRSLNVNGKINTQWMTKKANQVLKKLTG